MARDEACERAFCQEVSPCTRGEAARAAQIVAVDTLGSPWIRPCLRRRSRSRANCSEQSVAAALRGARKWTTFSACCHDDDGGGDDADADWIRRARFFAWLRPKPLRRRQRWPLLPLLPSFPCCGGEWTRAC